MSINHSKRAVIVFGKVPRAGRVKTRLTPELSPEMAAQVYRAFLLDVFSLVDRAAEDTENGFDRYFVCSTSAEDTADDVARLLPKGWALLAERGNSLGESIHAACEDVQADTVVVLGSDSPTMPRKRILEAFDAIENETTLASKPFVLGPTQDGGYYLVAMSQVRPAIFHDVVWSTEWVLEQTRKNAAEFSIPLVELSEGYDIDYVADFKRALGDAQTMEAHRTAKAITKALQAKTSQS
jgi:rSAM/selenodomain-associated transferase 1